MLPEWMKMDFGPPASEVREHKNSNKYLARTLRHINQTILDDLITEHYAAQNGLWQKIDPRLKLVSALALIILAGATRSLGVLLALWVFTVLMMYCSKLPLLVFQKRVWGFIPVLTLIAALPGMFNILIDGSPLLYIYKTSYPLTWLGLDLPQSMYVTRQGLQAAMFIFARVGISVSLGVLLTVTTPAASLMKALRVLGVPALFVMIIEMTYRYLLLLLATAAQMFEARSLRMIGEMSAVQKRGLIGSSIAVLFAKSMILSEEVYMAMTARGYTGEAVAAEDFSWARTDWLWSLAVIVLIMVLWMGEYWIGR